MSEEQPYHARVKLVPDEVSINGKDVRELQLCHALLKFTLAAAVPSFAPAGNDVRAVQDCHADPKFVPLEASILAIEVRDEQLRHVSLKLMLDDKSTLLNEVNPLFLNPAPMLVTDEKSISLSSSISDRCNHQPKISML